MQYACAILSSVSCPALQYFSILSHKLHDFRKKKYIYMYRTQNVCFNFPTTFVWNISHSVENWARYVQKCILVFMQSTRFSCHVLTKIEFYGLAFEKKKCSDIKFRDNPSSGSRIAPWGQTDSQSWQWSTQKFFFRGGGVQQIQLRTEDRQNGDLGA